LKTQIYQKLNLCCQHIFCRDFEPFYKYLSITPLLYSKGPDNFYLFVKGTIMISKFVLALLSFGFTAGAWAWQPTKPIEVTIGFAPGSGNELVFRALAQQVEKNTGAKFIVVNRAGAGGVVGNKHLVAQPSDGYHVGMVIGEGIPVQDKINVPANRGYEVNDFTYIMAPALNQYSIVAHVDDPVNTPRQLLDAIRSGLVTMGASGGARLVYEAMRSKVDFANVTRVEHNGPVPAINDVIGKHMRFAIVPSLVANRFIRDGKLKIITITGTERLSQIKDVQNLNVALPGFDVITTWGLAGPKNMPPAVVEWYVREFNRALTTPEVREFWAQNLLQVPSPLLTSAGFRDYVLRTERSYQPVVDKVLSEMQKAK